MTLLNKDKILAKINDAKLKNQLNFHIFTVIGSTNSFLKELAPSTKIEICCAEQQTNGRGRLNRTWHSPYAENIYFSCRYCLPANTENISALSLVTGLTIIDVLKKYCQNLQIKWPNDIYWQNKKLAGILIESNHVKNNCINLTIGIGININSDLHLQADKPWISLFNINQQKYDRNVIIASLIAKLDQNLHRLIKNSFQIFQQQWQQHDYLFAKELLITNADQQTSGTCLGVNSNGNLILTTKNGAKTYINCGEASIKKML